MQRFLKLRTFKDDYREELANERSEAERVFRLKVLAKKEVKNSAARCGDGSSMKDCRATMANPDLELLRLERALQQARDRLGRITRLVSDAAVRKAAENLCAEQPLPLTRIGQSPSRYAPPRATVMMGCIGSMNISPPG